MSKHVIITGTSRGIGFELVKLFSEQGYKVLALSRNEKPISDLKLTHVTALPFDLSRKTDFHKIETFVKNEWKHVDILINNAGAILNKPFSETTMDDFEFVYKTNVFGVAEMTRIVLPFMRNPSHVVTISSMGGVQGSVKFPGLAAYSSSKAAVITLTELWAEEYKETKIAFNVLALGAVQTEMLAEAFPGFEVPMTPKSMAEYIYNFAITGHKHFNGKLLQVSNSTP